MAIPTGVILIHTGANSAIPSGWARETTLDNKFVKGADVGNNPNDIGGAATHSHTSPAHSHSMAAHGHVVNIGTAGGDGNDSDSGGSELSATHSHNPTLVGLSGGDLSNVTSVYANVSNNPPYFAVIFIKATEFGLFPVNAIGLWAQGSIPTNFNNCDGTNGTTNLTNNFLCGANTSADAGATGGSYTNVHDLTHSHSESSHSHAQWIRESGGVPGGGRRGQGTNGGRTTLNHYHYYSLNANTAGSISSVTLTTPETVQPVYTKLQCIQNISGVTQPAPKYLIGLWLGSLATIPQGWALCDGSNGTPDMRSQYLKVAVDHTEIGLTGGSNTHTHASQGHSHTGGSHSHTSAMTDDNLRHNQNGDQGQNGVGGSWEVQNKDHTHGAGNVGTIVANTASWNSTNTTADSASNEPLFHTVAYIQLQKFLTGVAAVAVM